MPLHPVLARLGLDRDPRVSPPGPPRDGFVLSDNPATGEPIAAIRVGRACHGQMPGRYCPTPQTLPSLSSKYAISPTPWIM